MPNIIKDYKTLIKLPTFYERLAKLLNSGITIKKALDTIHQDETDPKFKKITAKIISKTHQGYSFIAILNETLPQHLPLNFTNSETIPNIAAFLIETAVFQKIKLSNLKSLAAKLIYPSFLLITTLSISILFIGFLLPEYHSFYKSLSKPLPKALSHLITLTAFIKKNTTPLILTSSLTLFIFSNKLLHTLKDKFHSVFFPENPADFLWLLAILLNSGLNIKKALSLFHFSSDTSFFKKFIYFKSDFLNSGNFATNLSSNFNLNAYQKELLINSEKTATLAKTLHLISTELKNTEQKKLINTLQKIQPALLLALGIAIFFFIYFTLLPVLNSIQNIL
jgi:type II secretory pathway component PulF